MSESSPRVACDYSPYALKLDVIYGASDVRKSVELD